MLTFPFAWMPDFGARSPGRDGEADPSAAWLKPVTVSYAGDREIEDRVVSEVASYGKQLGLIADALLEIADDRPGKAVERLRSVVNRVEQVKARFNRALEEKAEEAFSALLSADPVAAERLMGALEQRVATIRGAEGQSEAAE
jgi:hypothetical protein